MKNNNIDNNNAIAIIGMAGRFPNSSDIASFWDNLKQEKECITHFSNEELRAAGVSDALITHPKYVKARGILADIDLFDANFFGITPAEAKLMDPQQRLFLEMCWNALELSGYSALKERVVGVYAGMSDSTYLHCNVLKNKETIKTSSPYQMSIATSNHFLSTKISYYLNLTGPSIVINTACSTSLVAIVEACKALLSYECDLALAGGIAIRVPQITGYLYQEGGIHSSDGTCRAFDSKSSGIVSGNGGGVIVLKRLDEAIHAGDTIDAVIRSFAVNNDGAAKIGYTAPNILGQAGCIATALASLDSESISYIETHGTGTKLGDPIEIAALTKAFRHYTTKKNYCAIGSVKTNIGHTDVAAGVVGLIKTVLALKNKIIPASLYFNEANPEINFTDSPFFVNAQTTYWDAAYPRRAGVSSFGIGGTNAHLILEEAPLPSSQELSQEQFIIPISAKTSLALEQQQINLLNYLKQNLPDKTELAHIAYTLQVGRQTFNQRKVFVCDGVDELIELLQTDHKKQRNKSSGNLAEQWLIEGTVDWSLIHNGLRLKRIPLPTYSFERKSYWISPSPQQPYKEEKEPMSFSVYQPDWQLTTLPETPSYTPKNWLVFIDEFGVGEKISAHLNHLKINVIEVRPGEDFHQLTSSSFQINPSIKNNHQKLFDGLKSEKKLPERVLYCWALAHEKNTSIKINEETIPNNFLALIYFSQVFGVDTENNPFYLYIISNYLAKLLPEDHIYPEQSLLLGITSVIPQELPLYTGVIDIGDTEEKLLDNELITLLINESRMKPEKLLVTYRKGLRFTQHYKQYELPEPNRKAHLKKNGVYLLTGGLGKIGLKLADYLASHYEAHLILTTRSEAPYRSILPAELPSTSNGSSLEQQILDIKKQAGSLTIIQADVADYSQMSTVFQTIIKTHKKLDGVFHLAAVVDNSTRVLIKDLTQEQLRKQWLAKITGVNVLAQLIKQEHVDFCLLFSSMATILGGFGLCAYAAANNYLNYFAESQAKQSSTNWFSISWDAWNHSVSEDISHKTKNKALTAEQGMSIMANYFNFMDTPNLFITLNKRLNASVNPPISARRTASVVLAETQVVQPNSAKTTLEVLFKQILGLQELDPDLEFYNSGGDSLAAITLIELIEEQLSVRISLTDFLNNQSINKLVALIQQREITKTSLIPLKSASNSQKNLFFMHPISGTAFCYLNLIHFLPNCSFFAFHDPGLDSNPSHFKSLEEIASFYLQEIKQQQPEGPYLLGGYSFGATLAFEIARQLLANNEQVEKIFLIDGWALFSPQLHDKNRFDLAMQRILTELETQMPLLLTKKNELLEFWWKRMQLLLTYIPTPLSLELILFKAQETLPEYQAVDTTDNHWSSLTDKPIEIYPISGNHSTILHLPGAKEIGERIKDLLI